MKILVVCDGFPPEFAPRMGYLCKYLSRMNCTAEVVCEQYSDDRRFDFLADATSRVKRIRFFRSLKMPKPRAEWGTLMLRDLFFHYKDKRLVREIKKDTSFTGYDLVLCSTCRTFPLRAAASLAKHFRVPLVADLRDIGEQYPDNSYLAHRLPFASFFIRHQLKERNRVLKKAAAVVSVSEWHRDFLKRFNNNTHLIYNGYDQELFFPDHRHDSCFRIVFTGSIIHSTLRNPDWVFEAVSRLKKEGVISASDFRLCWYVEAAGKPILQNLAQKYGIEEVSECYDFIPATEVPALLNRSSILLQLSNIADAKGPKGIMTTKIFEALAVGKPLLLVRSDESYLAALIERYHCGLAAQNVESVMEFIKAQYQKWKQTGSTAIAVAPEIGRLYSRAGQAQQFLQLFKQILKDG